MVEFAVQQFVDVAVFKVVWNLQNLVKQIAALVAADKLFELDAQFFAEMFRNFLKDVRFRRCRKAAHGGGCRSVVVALGNEFGGIQIIGAEIVPPFGQAVCLVEYPAVNLAVFDGFDKARIAEQISKIA